MEQKTEEQKRKETESAKETARFLFNTVSFASAALVTKFAWNLGLASVFPRLPTINYMNAVSWLLLLYIAARVMSAGYMAEVERTLTMIAELAAAGLANIAELLPNLIKIRKVASHDEDMN
jgi:hypothetical protein